MCHKIVTLESKQTTPTKTLSSLPSRQQLGNLRPPIPNILMILQNHPILLQTPSLLTNIRIQMIMPPFPTLLPNPSGQMLRNHTPLLGTQFGNETFDCGIFFGGPGTFDEGGFEDLVPSVETLSFGTLKAKCGEVGGYFAPAFGSVCFNGGAEYVVLCVCACVCVCVWMKTLAN